MRSLLAALLVATLAACSEQPQEAARETAAAPATTAPTAPTATAPPGAGTQLPTASAPNPAAAASPRDEIRPGLIPAEAARPRLRPGEPTSNDAFRRAFEERSATRASGGS